MTHATPLRPDATAPAPLPAERAAAAPQVLVFDSGVGGLSVLAEIRAMLPAVRLTFAADNGGFPYGVKDEAELVARVEAVLRRLAELYRPDLVVLACNTASTVALPAVRAALPVPVVGVVPAIKPAARLSRSRVIGLLGTAGTVRRTYTQGLIDAFAADCTVLRHGSRELVEAAERKLRGEPVDGAAIRAVLDGLFGQPAGDRLDVVVLACTHFPLLRDELAAAAPRPVAWVDSGRAVARRVAELLGPLAEGAPAPRHRAVFTAATPDTAALGPALGRVGLDDIAIL